MLQILQDHWAQILAAGITIAEVIVRATPTKKDNSILNVIKSFVDAILPNKQTGGGTHP
ncbi:hypothetical protein [Limnovirga soli]|uniref:hypothetical protein n=1 Tax=Limnovirga soli TaxID=2656915 RepID=UPI001490E319|nr:hypothetical protein [Limnovirga soli]